MTRGAAVPAFGSPAFLWGPVVLHAAIIFALSSIPDLGALPGGVSDKSGHSIGYALLGMLLLRALAGGRLRGVTWGRALLTIVLATLYGMSDELHQSYVPGRDADRLDVVADCIGAAAGVALCGAVAAARAWGILNFSSRFRRRP